MHTWLLVVLMTLSACKSAGEFSLPKVSLPEMFTDAPTTAKPAEKLQPATDDLWRGFGDQTLAALIQHALKTNDSLEEARARITEARSLVRVSETALLPSLDATGKAGTGSRDNPFNDESLDNFEAGISASFEADLFGKNAAARDAKLAKAVQAEASLADVQRLLIADLALAYLELRNAEARIVTQKSAIADARNQRKLSAERERAGLTSQIDTLISSRELSQRRAELPALKTLRDQAISRIHLLAPDVPAPLMAELQNTQAMPEVPTITILATPAASIYARPDVRAAEAELISFHQELAQAVATQYPTVSLAAFFGWRDNGIAPQGDVWSLGSNLTAPLINFGRIEAQVNAADARKQAAVARYQRAVRAAVDDTQRALIAYRDAGATMQKRQQTLTLATQSQKLAEARYEKGLSSYLEVISANLAAFDAKNAKQIAHHQALRAAADLYRALGEPAQAGAASKK